MYFIGSKVVLRTAFSAASYLTSRSSTILIQSLLGRVSFLQTWHMPLIIWVWWSLDINVHSQNYSDLIKFCCLESCVTDVFSELIQYRSSITSVRTYCIRPLWIYGCIGTAVVQLIQIRFTVHYQTNCHKVALRSVYIFYSSSDSLLKISLCTIVPTGATRVGEYRWVSSY